ncbi:hypothetical protein BASA61_008438 [Batrachochytrium salamandrivorans]|nr:hypothetical protein BASA60_003438 [Batrachochytrium salamandrivorans]KAH6582654.1 hypothetical protein BASA61_008438 [Batrachochytrium salamandrivorans]
MLFDDEDIPELPEDLSMEMRIQQASAKLHSAQPLLVTPSLFHSVNVGASSVPSGPSTVPMLPYQQRKNDASDGSLQSRDPTSLKVKPRRVIAKLDADRLLGAKGFPMLLKGAKKMRFSGKGSELKDLERIIRMYQLWGYELFPKLSFGDFVERTEKVCHEKRLKLYMAQLFRDQEKRALGEHAIEAEYNDTAQVVISSDGGHSDYEENNVDSDLRRAINEEAEACASMLESVHAQEFLDSNIDVDLSSQSSFLKRRKFAIVDSDDETAPILPTSAAGVEKRSSSWSDKGIARYARSTVIPRADSAIPQETPAHLNTTPVSDSAVSTSPTIIVPQTRSTALTEEQRETLRVNRERAMSKLAARQAERDKASRAAQRAQEESKVAAMLAEAGSIFTDN